MSQYSRTVEIIRRDILEKVRVDELTTIHKSLTSAPAFSGYRDRFDVFRSGYNKSQKCDALVKMIVTIEGQSFDHLQGCIAIILAVAVRYKTSIRDSFYRSLLQSAISPPPKQLVGGWSFFANSHVTRKELESAVNYDVANNQTPSTRAIQQYNAARQQQQQQQQQRQQQQQQSAVSSPQNQQQRGGYYGGQQLPGADGHNAMGGTFAQTMSIPPRSPTAASTPPGYHYVQATASYALSPTSTVAPASSSLYPQPYSVPQGGDNRRYTMPANTHQQQMTTPTHRQSATAQAPATTGRHTASTHHHGSSGGSGSSNKHHKHQHQQPMPNAEPVYISLNGKTVSVESALEKMRFKTSALMTIHKRISPILYIQPTEDLRQCYLTIQVTTEIANKLYPADGASNRIARLSDRWRLMLFSSQFEMALESATANSTSNEAATIVYPYDLFEVYCSDASAHSMRMTNLVQSNLGKPMKLGTATPTDITALWDAASARNQSYRQLRIKSRVFERPYVVAAYLVEVRSVSDTIQLLHQSLTRTEEEVLAKLTGKKSHSGKSNNSNHVAKDGDGEDEDEDDDEIVAGHQQVSLKCPLGYMRLQHPVRGNHCPHAQCFDANTFLELNKKQATALCPVCDRVIGGLTELIVDGFMMNVLKSATDDDEHIYIRRDGKWAFKESDLNGNDHSTDDVLTSASSGLHQHSTNNESGMVTPPSTHSMTPTIGTNNTNAANSNKKSSRSEQSIIMCLDSEDEEGTDNNQPAVQLGMKRTLDSRDTPEQDNSSNKRLRQEPVTPPPQIPSSNVTEIIDLTWDSDDE